ncbi:MAG: divergent PAP2 family protein [Chloroflexi bacterium]|nr:divergent PAP2 family protein [Chloroflexota bacterium]MBI3733767.1 divergent PAP2 family protein [Chloroflexota bacterium]
MAELFANPVFVATLWAWIVAQLLKVALNSWNERRLNLRYLSTMGGMPSSHSATVAALATAVGLREGTRSSLFAVALILALVVMYDAAGVRRAAMAQARILNQIIDELFQGHPISETRLRELLGHTPFEVLVGALLGISIAYLTTSP